MLLVHCQSWLSVTLALPSTQSFHLLISLRAALIEAHHVTDNQNSVKTTLSHRGLPDSVISSCENVACATFTYIESIIINIHFTIL